MFEEHPEHRTLLPSHQETVVSCKCWEHTAAQCGQILLQMQVLSNSVYKPAQPLDRGFSSSDALCWDWEKLIQDSLTVCSLKSSVKLGSVTQLKPEQEGKPKQRQQRSYSLVPLFGITFSRDSYSYCQHLQTTALSRQAQLRTQKMPL